MRPRVRRGREHEWGATVNWGVASDDVGVAEYEVARCTGAGCTTYSVLATVAHPTVTYTDTTVGASTTYGYQVVAKDTAGQVGPAVTTTVVTLAGGPPNVVAQVNFQPPGATVPNGYVKDDGAVYSSARGYGWSTAVPTRERNNAGVEQRLDTLIHFDTGTTAAWNYDLANGDYLVTLASGDPNWSQGPHTVAVEGTTVIDGVSTSANEFITITEQPVTVTDGQLTVQLTRSGTAKTILNYVVITSVSP